MTSVSQIPKGLWSAFLYEMKKHKSFREGYHQGHQLGLAAFCLTREADSGYRHKFGALVACFEDGRVTDVELDKSAYSVRAYSGKKIIYDYREVKK